MMKNWKPAENSTEPQPQQRPANIKFTIYFININCVIGFGLVLGLRVSFFSIEYNILSIIHTRLIIKPLVYDEFCENCMTLFSWLMNLCQSMDTFVLCGVSAIRTVGLPVKSQRKWTVSLIPSAVMWINVLVLVSPLQISVGHPGFRVASS